MIDRKNRIDVFLKFWRDILSQNPDVLKKFNSNGVYFELTRLGVPGRELGKRIDHNFGSWINYFKSSDKCDVFVDSDWPYFCQFISKDRIAYNSDEHLKIYVPLDSEHIRRGAVEIFEFLSDNDISHVSKIGSDIRFDSIVIRLINQFDVDKLLFFLDNNDYIQEGLLTANPFAFCKSGIAMVTDGKFSFNDVVANLIFFYMKDKVNFSKLHEVSVDDFYWFIEKYYCDVFSTKEGICRLKDDFDIETLDEIVNHQNIMKLIVKINSEDFLLMDYFNHFNECINYKTQYQKMSNIYEMLNEVEVNNASVVRRK